MPQSQSFAELARRTAQRTQTGSPLYNNKSLEDAEARRKLGVTIERPEMADPYADEPSADQLIANAKGTLASSGRLLHDINSDANRQTMIDAEAESHQGEDSPSVFDSTATKLGRLGRQAIIPAATVGSFVPHPAINIPSQMILGAASVKHLAEASPTEMSEHPIMTGLDVLGTAAGIHGLSSLGGLGRAASSVGNPGMVEEVVNTAKGYRGQGMSQGQAGQRAGWPLGVSEEVTGYHPQSYELPPYRDGTFNIENPFEGGFNKDPNFHGGAGDPELAGSTPYRRTSGSRDPNFNGGMGDPELAGSTAYEDYARQFQQEMAQPAKKLSKISGKKPRPKGR